MHVRDALEADADALAELAGAPTDVMRNLVHDRTVRVAEDAARSTTVDADEDRYAGSSPEDLLGFVSFDAKNATVHVTQLDGSPTACERLLDEPIRFATRESMAVEVLVTVEDAPVVDTLDSLGFDRCGRGPRFAEARTVRFRLEP